MIVLNRRRPINTYTVVWNQLISNGIYNISPANTVPNGSYWLDYIRKFEPIIIQPNHIYAYIKDCTASNPKIQSTHDLRDGGGQNIVFTALSVENQLTRYTGETTRTAKLIMLRHFNRTGQSISGMTASGFIFLSDLTLMFGEGNEPTSISQYESWFVDNIGPLNVYQSYNTGQTIKVKYLPK